MWYVSALNFESGLFRIEIEQLKIKTDRYFIPLPNYGFYDLFLVFARPIIHIGKLSTQILILNYVTF